MGVQITELLVKRNIGLQELAGKVVAVDAHLFLYQFLTSIRQPDGSLLTNSKGGVTSHLIGLFSRTTNLMKKGIRLCYVFDGKAPKLKKQELAKRKERKMEARQQYETAMKKDDAVLMRKYAARTTRLTPELITEAQNVIAAFGLPIIQAPAEGEAQAAHLVKTGKAFCVASQDTDSLLFGTPKLIRNISIAGKRKKSNTLAYETVRPELFELSANLNHLGIDQKQLIALALLVGTDYNPGGVKGLGPKKALALVQKTANLETLFAGAKWNDFCDTSWEEIFELIAHMPVTDDYDLTWTEPDAEKLHALLVDKHEFSEERVRKGITSLIKEKGKMHQKGLGDFF